MEAAEELGEGDSFGDNRGEGDIFGDASNDPPAPLGANADSTSMPPPLLVHDADEANKTARAQQMKGLCKKKNKELGCK